MKTGHGSPKASKPKSASTVKVPATGYHQSTSWPIASSASKISPSTSKHVVSNSVRGRTTSLKSTWAWSTSLSSRHSTPTTANGIWCRRHIGSRHPTTNAVRFPSVIWWLSWNSNESPCSIWLIPLFRASAWFLLLWSGIGCLHSPEKGSRWPSWSVWLVLSWWNIRTAGSYRRLQRCRPSVKCSWPSRLWLRFRC